ncbi:MAG: type II secretion system protein [Planctomycetota bacterium]
MKYSKRCGSKGLTLVEVIVSITLLATLLTGMLIAHSRHIRQLTLSRQTAAASRLADELLASWFKSGQPFPGNETGVLGDDGQYVWVSKWRAGGTDNPRWQTRVVSVEVFHRSSPDVALFSTELLDDIPFENNGGR